MTVRTLSIFGTMMGGAALLIGGTAMAGEISGNWTCRFTTECFEQEACAETAYDVSVSYDISELDGKPGEGAGVAKIVDPSATRQAVVSHNNGAFSAGAVDFGASETIAPEIFQIIATASGDARLVTAITAAPMVITYHGTCEAEGS